MTSVHPATATDRRTLARSRTLDERRDSEGVSNRRSVGTITGAADISDELEPGLPTLTHRVEPTPYVARFEFGTTT